MDKIYFAGYRLEHFTGWNGVGTPTYYSLGSTSSLESNNLGYIELTNNQVLWSSINNNDFDPIYLTAELYHDSTNHFGNIYLCDTDNNTVGIGFNRNYDDYLIINTWSGVYNGSSGFTSRTSLESITETFNQQNGRVYRFYLKLSSSNGEEYDTLETFYSSSANSYALTSIGSFKLSAPLKNIKSSFCFKDTIYNTYGYSTLFYLVVANFDLSNTYLDYTTASSIGSTNQWSGNVSTFSTYPVSYSSTGGMTSSTNNTSVSYNLTKTLNTTQSSYTPLVMILSSNNISSNNSLYTNGYSGTYNITIPNYLASGTGISIVEYIPAYSGTIDSIFGGTAGGISGVGNGTPGIIINDNGKAVASGYSSYYNNIHIANTAILANSLNYGAWNQFTIFNNNGTLTLTTNSVSGTTTKTISDTEFKFNVDKNRILAGVAYINSNTVPTYPFDKASNVISYIDFVDPNNPVIYGDTTQFTITSKTLTSITPSNIPTISISSTTKISTATISPFITDGTNSITTSDTATVTSTGNNSTFYLLEDPITNSYWTSSNIQKYQFGLTKID